MTDMFNPEFDEPLLVECAQWVGRLCNTWARLELEIVNLCGALLQAPNDDVSNAMIQAFDFRAQISAIRLGAVARELPSGWAELIHDEVDYIDQTLRPRRNRYVHSMWLRSSEGELWRVDQTPRVYRAQAKQPLSWAGRSVVTETISAIRETVAEIDAHGGFVFQLASDLSWPPLPDLAARLGEQPRRALARS
ncbi:hypothetical protein [Phenylobacterium sp.]|uniref:hypothetical protein n=2 Tax=Phenylobacterium sp. TaxID=1871053 RepID=UPI00179CC682|nr:hypothetical protein [Phenylobacterium sp.]MBA4795459.1 hypothetical protein [Phenylobacterium sp.]